MKIVELVLFTAVALFFAIFEGSFVVFVILIANGQSPPFDQSTYNFGFGLLVVGGFGLYRWARRLWLMWRNPAAPQA
jgi:hypothetical protein